MRATYFFLVLSVFLLALLAIVVHYYRRRIRTEKYPYGSWEKLLGRFSAVNRENLALIALSLVDEFGQRREDENDADMVDDWWDKGA